jgi:hypothetical protein
LTVLKLKILFCVTVRFTGPTQVNDSLIPEFPSEAFQLAAMPSAFAGVDFSLVVTPPSGAPTPCISPNFSVTYASRFIQISTNLFDVLGTLCDRDSGWRY